MEQLYYYAYLKNKPYLDKWVCALFDKMIDKNSYEIISKVLKDDEHSEYYQDIIKWIFMVMCIDIPYLYTTYDYEKIRKERKKDYEDNKKNILKSLQILESNQQLFTENTKQHLQKTSELIIQELSTTYIDKTFYNKNTNHILSQKILSETGLRDLTLRYITVIFQICLKPKNIKYSSKLIYEVLKSVLPDHIDIGNLGVDTINKYIKDIDITKQNYSSTFENMGVHFEILENNEQEKLFAQTYDEPYKQYSTSDKIKVDKWLRLEENSSDDIELITFDWLAYYHKWKYSEVYQLYIDFINR